MRYVKSFAWVCPLLWLAGLGLATLILGPYFAKDSSSFHADALVGASVAAVFLLPPVGFFSSFVWLLTQKGFNSPARLWLLVNTVALGVAVYLWFLLPVD